MTFNEVLPQIKLGWVVSNPVLGKDKLVLFKPTNFSSVTIEFLYIERDNKMHSVYIPTQQDLSDDYWILEEFRS